MTQYETASFKEETVISIAEILKALEQYPTDINTTENYITCAKKVFHLIRLSILTSSCVLIG